MLIERFYENHCKLRLCGFDILFKCSDKGLTNICKNNCAALNSFITNITNCSYCLTIKWHILYESFNVGACFLHFLILINIIDAPTKAIIGSYNCLSPVWRQAIIWANAAFKNVVWEISAIITRSQCVKHNHFLPRLGIFNLRNKIQFNPWSHVRHDD